MLIQIHLPCTNSHCPLKDVGVENVYNTELKLKIRIKSLAIIEYYECQISASCLRNIFLNSFLKLKSVS